MIAGPSLGGVIYAATGKHGVVYVACAAMALVAFASVIAIGHAAARARRERSVSRATWSTVARRHPLRLVGQADPRRDLARSLRGAPRRRGRALADLRAMTSSTSGRGASASCAARPAVGAATTALAARAVPAPRARGPDRCSPACSLFGVATIVFGALEELRALARRRSSCSARPT